MSSLREQVDAARKVALRAVLEPTNEDMLRHVFRTYSKTFHTPLHEVYELPLLDVLLAYFEETFSEMEPDRLAATRRSIVLTDEEILSSEEEDMKMLEEMRQEALELEKKEKAAQKAPEGFSISFKDVT